METGLLADLCYARVDLCPSECVSLSASVCVWQALAQTRGRKHTITEA